MSSAVEAQITLSLSQPMLERLEEMARASGVTAEEKAETMLNLALMKDYQPKTPEEYRSMSEENKKKFSRMMWEMTRVMYRNLFRAVLRRIKQVLGIDRKLS